MEFEPVLSLFFVCAPKFLNKYILQGGYRIWQLPGVPQPRFGDFYNVRQSSTERSFKCPNSSSFPVVLELVLQETHAIWLSHAELPDDLTSFCLERVQLSGHVCSTYVFVGPVVLGEYFFISVRRSVGDDHNGAVTLGAAISHVHLPATRDHTRTHKHTKARVTRAQLTPPLALAFVISFAFHSRAIFSRSNTRTKRRPSRRHVTCWRQKGARPQTYARGHCNNLNFKEVCVVSVCKCRWN